MWVFYSFSDFKQKLKLGLRAKHDLSHFIAVKKSVRTHLRKIVSVNMYSFGLCIFINVFLTPWQMELSCEKDGKTEVQNVWEFILADEWANKYLSLYKN